MERDVGTTLFHRFEAFGRYTDGNFLAELRYKEGLCLEIDLAAALAGGIVFGRTRTVGIAAADLRVLTCYFANTRHIRVPHATISAMDAQILGIFLVLVVIIFSTIIHEVMHGAVADYLGDPTARYAGRLTLNPLKHLDLMGSFIIPILTYISLGTAFGYAKPVPINPYNLKGRFGEALVAAAGPASNIFIALLAGLTLRFVAVSQGMADILFTFTYINVLLCIFNLIPIPPLDGSRVLAAILPRPLSLGYDRLRGEMERNPLIGMGIVLVVVMLFGGAFGNLIFALASAIAGQ